MGGLVLPGEMAVAVLIPETALSIAPRTMPAVAVRILIVVTSVLMRMTNVMRMVLVRTLCSNQNPLMMGEDQIVAPIRNGLASPWRIGRLEP